MASASMSGYPVTFDVDYPEGLNRLTTLLRLIWAIPTLLGITLVTFLLMVLSPGIGSARHHAR